MSISYCSNNHGGVIENTKWMGALTPNQSTHCDLYIDNTNTNPQTTTVFTYQLIQFFVRRCARLKEKKKFKIYRLSRVFFEDCPGYFSKIVKGIFRRLSRVFFEDCPGHFSKIIRVFFEDYKGVRFFEERRRLFREFERESRG